MDETRLLDDMDRGFRAAELLKNELLQEAFVLLEKRYIQALKDSPQRDVEGRENIVLMLKLLSAVKGQIEEFIESGKVAHREWEKHKSFMERMRERANWSDGWIG